VTFLWNQQQTKGVHLMVKRCLKSKILYFNKVFQFHKIWQLLTRQIDPLFGLKPKTYSIKQVPIINFKGKKKKVILKYVFEIVIKILNEISPKNFQQFQPRLIMGGRNKLHKIIHFKSMISRSIVKYHRLNHLLNHSN